MKVSIPHRYAENFNVFRQAGKIWVFQSLIGMLKTVAPVTRKTSGLRFQSLIGMLKTESDVIEIDGAKLFQSLIGMLKTPAFGLPQLNVITGFNPS